MVYIVIHRNVSLSSNEMQTLLRTAFRHVSTIPVKEKLHIRVLFRISMLTSGLLYIIQCQWCLTCLTARRWDNSRLDWQTLGPSHLKWHSPSLRVYIRVDSINLWLGYYPVWVDVYLLEGIFFLYEGDMLSILSALHDSSFIWLSFYILSEL